MRIGTLFFNNRTTSDMLKAQSNMAETQLQIASGRRIVTPSDDPSGAKTVLDTTKFLETTQQYQDNIQILRGRLEMEESVLANTSDILQRLREIAIQGNTDTYTTADKALMAEEVDRLRDQLLSLANTQDANNEYLFSGFMRDTPPFSDAGGGTFNYDGDTGERQLHIASDRLVEDADNASEMFGVSGGGANNLFSAVYDMAANLRAGNPLTTDISNLETAFDRVVKVRTDAGARLQTTEQQESANEDFMLHFETQLGEVRDLDYAEAISRFNLQQVALQAAQQSYVKVQGLSLFNYI